MISSTAVPGCVGCHRHKWLGHVSVTYPNNDSTLCLDRMSMYSSPFSPSRLKHPFTPSAPIIFNHYATVVCKWSTSGLHSGLQMVHKCAMDLGQSHWEMWALCWQHGMPCELSKNCLYTLTISPSFLCHEMKKDEKSFYCLTETSWKKGEFNCLLLFFWC